MAAGLSGGMADAQANNAKSILDDGVLEIRSGTRPATASLAPTGTLLASIALPATAFTAASSGTGQIALSGTWTDSSADAGGTATWFRFQQQADAGTENQTDERIDGNITAPDGGGDIELDSTTIEMGQAVTIVALTMTQATQAAS